jgi:hypothetical protein
MQTPIDENSVKRHALVIGASSLTVRRTYDLLHTRTSRLGYSQPMFIMFVLMLLR